MGHSLINKTNFPLGDRGMKKIKVTQVKSVIDRPERQKRTMVALGLKKMNASVEVEATPQILGMVRKVNHLISVVELA